MSANQDLQNAATKAQQDWDAHRCCSACAQPLALMMVERPGGYRCLVCNPLPPSTEGSGPATPASPDAIAAANWEAEARRILTAVVAEQDDLLTERVCRLTLSLRPAFEVRWWRERPADPTKVTRQSVYSDKMVQSSPEPVPTTPTDKLFCDDCGTVLRRGSKAREHDSIECAMASALYACRKELRKQPRPAPSDPVPAGVTDNCQRCGRPEREHRIGYSQSRCVFLRSVSAPVVGETPTAAAKRVRCGAVCHCPNDEHFCWALHGHIGDCAFVCATWECRLPVAPSPASSPAGEAEFERLKDQVAFFLWSRLEKKGYVASLAVYRANWENEPPLNKESWWMRHAHDILEITEVARLTAENAELKKFVNEGGRIINGNIVTRADLDHRLAEREAEISRLKAALLEIASHPLPDPPHDWSDEIQARHWKLFARGSRHLAQAAINWQPTPATSHRRRSIGSPPPPPLYRIPTVADHEMTPAPKAVRDAFAEYQKTDAYANAIAWCKRGGPHTEYEGELWAAFEAGWRMAQLQATTDAL